MLNKYFSLVSLLILFTVTGCSSEKKVLLPVGDNYPESLSAWGVLWRDSNRLVINQKVIPYDLNTALFSDYAHKFRTVWVPEGETAVYRQDDTFDFPVGSVITKTFYYPSVKGGSHNQVLKTSDYSQDFVGQALNLNHLRLIETRVLYHSKNGWVALPYVWNEEQTDAVLEITGGSFDLELVSEESGSQLVAFNYSVPDANQCVGCHAPNHSARVIKPIGPKARHLNKTYFYASGEQQQINYWRTSGILKGVPSLEKVPQNALWTLDAKNNIDHRARSYLDINCGHCHNPVGAADTSGLFLDIAQNDDLKLGVCKPPVAAGQGTGGHLFSIVPEKPDESILLYRMHSLDPGAMMPELGRATVHKEGVDLIQQWIRSMKGNCS
ncbi:SO2930 family diheme c-type cytochrome [Pleionea sp. CnH1-48]|uniref:SO2930 family diheme c-type cytochrome n=1 Tax=Pleionea sp. CnH1-48 TaxID=2954494 RepID=UPI00209821E4|nr:SO2930 family diheme c-type cytochrome [Pleionea sp. CnH1-48]MCO7227439.1 hypothetical protein [Pleionea sp. CnH1-48]